MKGKYITYQILLACLSKPPVQVQKETPVESEEKSNYDISKSTAEESPESFESREAA
jgi:hypothetical protein